MDHIVTRSLFRRRTLAVAIAALVAVPAVAPTLDAGPLARALAAERIGGDAEAQGQPARRLDDDGDERGRQGRRPGRIRHAVGRRELPEARQPELPRPLRIGPGQPAAAHQDDVSRSPRRGDGGDGGVRRLHDPGGDRRTHGRGAGAGSGAGHLPHVARTGLVHRTRRHQQRRHLRPPQRRSAGRSGEVPIALPGRLERPQRGPRRLVLLRRHPPDSGRIPSIGAVHRGRARSAGRRALQPREHRRAERSADRAGAGGRACPRLRVDPTGPRARHPRGRARRRRRHDRRRTRPRASRSTPRSAPMPARSWPPSPPSIRAGTAS